MSGPLFNMIKNNIVFFCYSYVNVLIALIFLTVVAADVIIILIRLPTISFYRMQRKAFKRLKLELLLPLGYSIAYTSDKREVAADQRDGAARSSRSAKDDAARKNASLSSSSAKEVANYHIQGEGQGSSPAKAVVAYRRHWAGQKTESAHLSPSTKKVGNYRRDGTAQRSGYAKDVAARKSATLSSSFAKKVADYRIQGEGHRSSPAKAVGTYRRNWAAHKSQSAHLSSSTKKVGNNRKDGTAQRSGSAKDVAARKNATLSSFSAKEVVNYRIQGEGQRSSSAKAVVAYRRNWAGQKTQSAHLSSSTKKVGNYRRDGAAQRGVSVQSFGFKQKVPLGSQKKRDYTAPVTNVSRNPSTSFTVTEKTRSRPFARTLNSKATKKMLRRIMFTKVGRDELPLKSEPSASKKPVRFRMPTRIGRSGNIEIVKPTTPPLPTFDPLKPIGRSWRPAEDDITVQSINIMTQIVYGTQGQNMERVERIAERYKHDTRYRMAFILLKLDLICTEMTRKQTFIQYKLVKHRSSNYHIQRFYPFRKVLGFYTDMLRQNIDVTYAVEYLFRLYKEKALERQSVKEARNVRNKMMAGTAKKD